MSEPLTEAEVELFRKNFVEKLREPMRSDFRRIIATINDLRTRLSKAEEVLAKEGKR